MTRPHVSVVVPYFERQDQLDRLAAGLAVQTLAPESFELIVADDGSACAPRLPTTPYAARIVRQPDAGFRLAAARNLGAAGASGPVLAFLDQDCVPGPDYLQRVLDTTSEPWDLTVGHRHHVDLDGWSAAAVCAWLDGSGPGPARLSDPQWLVDGYERTLDLARPDERAYQLVIGAALSLHRRLFEHLGGFDESFRCYGGEDWELGHRALVAGADLRWVADAVVWHDGPDLAGRGELAPAKNAETIALARLVPDRDLRGEHLVWRQPDVVVRLAVGEAAVAGVIASVESLLVGTDAHVWLVGPDDAPGLAAGHALDDPRVHVGEPAADVLRRARWRVDCDPVLLDGTTLRGLCAEAPVVGPGLRVTSTRDLNQAARGVFTPSPHSVGLDVVAPVAAGLVLERHWQRCSTRLSPR